MLMKLGQGVRNSVGTIGFFNIIAGTAIEKNKAYMDYLRLEEVDCSTEDMEAKLSL